MPVTGWCRAPEISRKEKRGMGLAAVTFLVYVGLCVLLAFGPWNTVRSAIGTLSDSPLADGFWGVCSLGVALLLSCMALLLIPI